YDAKDIPVSYQEFKGNRIVCAMAAVFPVSLLSLLTYSGSAAGDGLLFSLLIPGALGGLLGAFLSGRIGRKTLKKVFAAVVIFGGAYMIAGR
ncbi:MAG: sulfite exporter TauE/SafE family protein, partial [Clostridia bacterium]|nr:sulfite exporter TauE/SafE family protein [Clostridia bacterium]